MSSSQTDSGIRGLLERLLEGALTDDLIADGVIAESVRAGQGTVAASGR